MRSTEGLYYSRLDHVRAFAAYLVFMWHFLHMTPNYPVPYAGAPIFPFALFDEGHTGVALFMTLSGYLFAKLVGDKQIAFGNFLWSRAVRLAPLLIVCIGAWVLIGYLSGAPIPARDIVGGFLLPTWPFGTWSISIELHFYLLFPLLLLAVRRYGPLALLGVIAAAIAFRIDWWLTFGEAQHIAYWTIFGRIDQFVLGMLFALAAPNIRLLRVIGGISLAAFLAFWQVFDAMGGYHNHTGAPSPSAVWIFIPTLEAVTWGSLIALYERSTIKMPAIVDRTLAKVGEWSYSIYLLHFLPIVLMRNLFWERHGSPSDFYVAFAIANLAFLAFLPIAGASYSYFEKRFLAYRRSYLRPAFGQQITTVTKTAASRVQAESR
jgi:peptidoglycan/LPS O-acetylase OafA/YrhL